LGIDNNQSFNDDVFWSHVLPFFIFYQEPKSRPTFISIPKNKDKQSSSSYEADPLCCLKATSTSLFQVLPWEG
jgi:hypothetical protein